MRDCSTLPMVVVIFTYLRQPFVSFADIIQQFTLYGIFVLGGKKCHFLAV